MSPEILTVEPDAAEPWSYVVITGRNLVGLDGSCQILIGGLAAFVTDCASSQVRAIVPWQAKDESIEMTGTNGGAVASFELLPLETKARTVRPGYISIKLRSGRDVATAVARQGDNADTVERMGDAASSFMKDWYQISVPVGSEFGRAVAYSGDPDVAYAGPVPYSMTTAGPNDPCYPSPRLPQCPVQSSIGQWALQKIQAENAWSQSKGAGVKIAVIDTGFATGHGDLASHMTTGWNCDGTSDVSPLNFHGTHTAGVAAAVTNNGTGIAGVGWDSSILPLRVVSLNQLGTCNQPNGDLYIIDRAVEGAAKVISMSYSYEGPFPAVCSKLEEAWHAGLLSVASAGNKNSTAPEDPAGCSRVTQ
jgi:thermitase